MKDLFGHDKVVEAIERLRIFKPSEGYLGATSFGKDSVVLMDLVKRSNVGVEWIHKLTTLDPPELIYFGRRFKDVLWIKPHKPLLYEAIMRGFPTRQNRWCCSDYKENFGSGRTVLLGIRKAESRKRQGRKFVEHCFKDESKIYVNPILDWSDNDIWNYIKENSLPYCSLYDEGFKRIGCIMCPLGSTKNRFREMRRWPKYAEAWKRTFKAIWENKKTRELDSIRFWNGWEDMFNWWMNGDSLPNEDQTVMFE